MKSRRPRIKSWERVQSVSYTHLDVYKRQVEGISAYNANLNDRLARKEKRYLERSQQLDIVIVVNRLLTGFDAPCLSTIFIDRQPMKPQEIIQAFSRTNRLFDDTKQYGQVVTFQSPDEFKEAIDCALRMYSLGGDGETLAAVSYTHLDVYKRQYIRWRFKR